MDRTVGIIEFAHCGTTMVAGICHILGVPMVSENYKRNKLEDLDVINTIADEQAFAKLVKERNERHGTWGFKRPGAWTFPDSLVHLRNPIYLAIYKDPVSVTHRRFGGSQIRLSHKIRNTGRQMKHTIDGIYAWNPSVHFLSYCRAIIAPKQFVQEIAEVIQIDPSEEAFNKAVRFIRPNVGSPIRPYAEADSWI